MEQHVEDVPGQNGKATMEQHWGGGVTRQHREGAKDEMEREFTIYKLNCHFPLHLCVFHLEESVRYSVHTCGVCNTTSLPRIAQMLHVANVEHRYVL